mgnify:CR=1 FL=1
MTNTVTLRADHLGSDKPYVNGHQYTVVGDCNITAYRTGAIANDSVNINAATSGDTYTRATGSFITDGFVAGDHIVIVGSAGANDLLVSKVESVAATIITVDDGYGGTLTDDTGGGEVITHAGEKVLASDFGLSTIASVELLQVENHDNNVILGDISADGTYFYVYLYKTGSAALLAASLQSGDCGVLGMKITGNL